MLILQMNWLTLIMGFQPREPIQRNQHQPNCPARLEVSQEADWAFESCQIAKTKIYPGMDSGPQDYSDNPLPSDYFDKMRPIVDQQLEKAGIRLAYVLNEVLK